MNASEALQVVDRLASTIQRMRSLAFERDGSGVATETMLGHLAPWVHGPKCLLPALSEIQDRGSVTASELHNLCFVAHSLEPSVALNASLMSGPIPEPSHDWLRRPWTSPA